MAILYISPTGSGTHDGSSPANAGNIASLPKFIAAAGPGGEVRLLANKGAYNISKEIAISAGGKTGAPVFVHGWDSSTNQPKAATFFGTRPADWKPGAAAGTELFRLLAGASHLAFADLAVKNFGNGVFRIGADITDLTIKRVTAANVSRFIEDYVSGTAKSASVNGLLVQDVTVNAYSQNAIRLKYNSQNIKLLNVVGDAQKKNEGLVTAGVSIDGTAHNILFDHVTMKNNYGHGGTADYWNGDGFVVEGGVYNVTFQDTVAAGNTDAGYDVKSSNTKFIRATAIGNNENYRLWGENVTVVDSVSTNPIHYGGIGKTSHLWVASAADITLDNFRYSDPNGAKVFDMSNGGNAVKLVDMAMPATSLMHLGNNSIIKLPGGLVMNGTNGNDTLAGGAGNDMLIGNKGNDTFMINAAGDKAVEQGNEGTDLIKTSLSSYTLADHVENLTYTGTANFTGTGNNLANTLTGGAHNDRLAGGAGNDLLIGGNGADTYVFGKGDKSDTINNADSAGSPDVLLFKAGITENQLWFAKNGNDLLVTVRGTGNTDSVRIKGWYAASSNQLSRFQLNDGQILEAARVQQMVQAMASFTSSAGTPTSMNSTQQHTVETVMAANWHPKT